MKKKTILIIEDEAVLRNALKTAIDAAGYTAEVAVDGFEGLKKIFSLRPDLILLDLIMPQKNGWEVLKEIKNNTATQEIPVIVLTAVGEEKSISDCVKLGISGYFIKTDYSLGEVIDKIKLVLKK